MLNLRIGRIFGFGPAREGTVATSNAGGGGGRNAPGSPFAVAGGPASGAVAAVNRRYNVSISMSIRNLFNHNNPGPYHRERHIAPVRHGKPTRGEWLRKRYLGVGK